MKLNFPSVFVMLIVCATAAIAHSGVKDPQVKARMDLMGLVAKDMKILGGLAKGQTVFDLGLLSGTATSLANHARKIEDFFRARAHDPKSEAKDTIWSDWDGFLAQADDMEDAAKTLATVTTKQDFQTTFSALGKTCSSCHEDYRINKN